MEKGKAELISAQIKTKYGARQQNSTSCIGPPVKEKFLLKRNTMK